MRKNSQILANLLKAKDPLILALTHEEHELVQEVCEIVRKTNMENNNNGKLPFKVYTFSRPMGLVEIDILNPDKYSEKQVVPDVMGYNDVFDYIKKLQYKVANAKPDIVAMINRSNGGADTSSVPGDGNPAVFILKDLHMFFNEKDIIRYLRDFKELYRQDNYCPIIVTAPVIDFPPELEKIFTLYEMPLLTTEEINIKISGLMKKLGATEQNIKDVSIACTGLTNREIDRAIAHSLVNNDKKSISAKDIYQEKLSIVKKSGALDFINPEHTLDDLGGCDNFKLWLKKIKEAMSEKARAYGIPAPKGAMLVGVPGTSKSVSAEILASYLNIPLISLDIGKVMGSFVGQSEHQIANALRIAKAIAPCVLLLDEAEKVLGGLSSSNSCDSGTLSRVVGQILNFLQEENTGVITLMTSNDVSALPPELTRTGRIDAQWMFDLPNKYERKEIINIYLAKNRLICSDKEIQHLVDATANFTGAEIKSAVKDILINAYYRQMNNGIKKPDRNITVADIDGAVSNTVTVYRSSREKIEAFREFSKGRYLNASKTEDELKAELSPKAKQINFTSSALMPKKKVSFVLSSKE